MASPVGGGSRKQAEDFGEDNQQAIRNRRYSKENPTSPRKRSHSSGNLHSSSPKPLFNLQQPSGDLSTEKKHPLYTGKGMIFSAELLEEAQKMPSTTVKKIQQDCLPTRCASEPNNVPRLATELMTRGQSEPAVSVSKPTKPAKHSKPGLSLGSFVKIVKGDKILRKINAYHAIANAPETGALLDSTQQIVKIRFSPVTAEQIELIVLGYIVENVESYIGRSSVRFYKFTEDEVKRAADDVFVELIKQLNETNELFQFISRRALVLSRDKSNTEKENSNHSWTAFTNGLRVNRLEDFITQYHEWRQKKDSEIEWLHSLVHKDKSKAEEILKKIEFFREPDGLLWLKEKLQEVLKSYHASKDIFRKPLQTDWRSLKPKQLPLESIHWTDATRSFEVANEPFKRLVELQNNFHRNGSSFEFTIPPNLIRKALTELVNKAKEIDESNQKAREAYIKLAETEEVRQKRAADLATEAKEKFEQLRGENSSKESGKKKKVDEFIPSTLEIPPSIANNLMEILGIEKGEKSVNWVEVLKKLDPSTVAQPAGDPKMAVCFLLKQFFMKLFAAGFCKNHFSKENNEFIKALVDYQSYFFSHFSPRYLSYYHLLVLKKEFVAEILQKYKAEYYSKDNTEPEKEKRAQYLMMEMFNHPSHWMKHRRPYEEIEELLADPQKFYAEIKELEESMRLLMSDVECYSCILNEFPKIDQMFQNPEAIKKVQEELKTVKTDEASKEINARLQKLGSQGPEGIKKVAPDVLEFARRLQKLEQESKDFLPQCDKIAFAMSDLLLMTSASGYSLGTRFFESEYPELFKTLKFKNKPTKKLSITLNENGCDYQVTHTIDCVKEGENPLSFTYQTSVRPGLTEKGEQNWDNSITILSLPQEKGVKNPDRTVRWEIFKSLRALLK